MNVPFQRYANVDLPDDAQIDPFVVLGKPPRGAVVTRDVPPGMVVIGSPARAIKRIDEIDVYRPDQD